MSSTFVLRKDDADRPQILQNLIAFATSLPANKSWEIEIGPHVKERTTKQNKALFGLAYPILEKATGIDKEDWHEYFCGRHFGVVELGMLDGSRKTKPRRTTTTNERGARDVIGTVEFAEFFDRVQREAAGGGHYIPDPSPLWKETREL
jgi:hypothetical protein